MVSIQQVKNRSWVFTFDSSPDWNLNIHLILGEHRDYIIDTGLGSLSMEPVKPYLRQDKPMVIVNTHFHWDHVWGNAVFDGNIIISHSLCRKRIDERWDGMLERNRQYIAGEALKRLPNLVFDDALYFPDDGIRIFYTPGHTEDSVSVFDEKDGVLDAADNIGDDMEHIVPELECDREIYVNTLQKLRSTGADAVVSGHNEIQSGDIFDRIMRSL